MVALSENIIDDYCICGHSGDKHGDSCTGYIVVRDVKHPEFVRYEKCLCRHFIR